MKKQLAIIITIFLIVAESSYSCTNYIVTKGASKDGSTFLVYTNDGEEYLGTLHHNSGSEQPREVTLRNPTKILRLENGEIDEKEWGKEILFPEKDIKRIVFNSEV